MASSRPYLTRDPNGVAVTVHVSTRASRTRIAGVHNDRLKVTLNAPPLEGRANKALVELLAKTFRCPKGSIEIVAGESSREKRLRISGLALDTAAALLDEALASD